MLDLLQTIAITIATLGILVTVHEYGHFWVARRCGIKVLRFSIGFGTSLYKWHDQKGTEFVIAAIPLGGYVKMLDEREGEVAPEELHQAFTQKPVLQRIAVVSAGPIANFLLAILAFWLVYVLGVQGIAPIIDKIEPDSIAEHAGLEAGQEIISVDGKLTPTWRLLNMQLLARIGETGILRFGVKYEGSDIVYESQARLTNWLATEEAPNLIEALGITLYRPKLEARVAEVVADSPAQLAGLQVDDLIVGANGLDIKTWSQWVDIVRDTPEQKMTLRIERSGTVIETSITPARKVADDGTEYGQVGVVAKVPEWPPELIREERYSLIGACLPALKQTWETTLFTLVSIKKMLMGLISPKNLSGPITIAKVASASAKSGFASYISFLALLSVSLGVLNFLPIPVLDGGHLLFYIVELLKGSPVPEKIQLIGFQFGFFIIVGIMMLALYNDIARL